MQRPAILLMTILLVGCPSAFALDPSLDISQYAHASWKMRDGYFKAPIEGIAQTPDGYLWVGTELGLFRFDGVRAFPWQPPQGEHLPSNLIIAVLAARNGALWIGTDKGLVSWKDDKLTIYPELAGRWITTLLEDHKGTIWAGTFASARGGLCEIQNINARCYGDAGTFSDGILSLYEDNGGNLWLGGLGLWRWNDHGTAKRLPLPIEVRSSQGLIGGDKGTLLFANEIRQLKRAWPYRIGILNLVTEKVQPYPFQTGRKFEPSHFLRDHDGGLWIGTSNEGLFHVHHGRVDRYGAADGLSGDYIRALYEDREGDVWVATINGLDRFHDAAVTTVSLKQGLSSDAVEAVLAASDGSVWLSTFDGLNRLKDGRITIYRKRNGLPDDHIQSLFQDKAGRLWVSTDSGLAYFEDDRFIPVRGVTGRTLNCIGGDDAGNLWITDHFEGLSRLRAASVVERIPWDRLGLKPDGMSLAVEPEQGGVWFAPWNGGLLYFKDHQLRASYAAADGLGHGHISDVHRDQRGTLWVATEGGLSRLSNGHVVTLTNKNGLPCDTVQWVMPGDDYFWLNMACGLVRIARPELEAWANDPKRKLQLATFDSSDGIRMVGLFGPYAPHVTKATDGKLWFLPGDGVSVIDPRRLPFNELPPPVRIEQITADGKKYDADDHLRIPPLVRDLAIDYTALSLVAPEKIHFRFMLEGQDPNWREVVNNREVQYSNLKPGNYRFRVTACNNSGVWNKEGASLDFVIPPAWYQTNWFRMACVAAFLAIIWGIFELRGRRLEVQFNMRLEERIAERTRIARDLHDTLLQSFQGLLLLFKAISYRLQPGDIKKSLDAAIGEASQAITEGRDTVQGLRASTIEKNDLAEAIRAFGEELASGAINQSPVAFEVVVKGRRRRKRPFLRDEVYRIAVEALRNAFRHAQADQIEVELQYGDKEFTLCVRDNGKGIYRDVLSADGRKGHFGLHGMRERAKLAGGELAIWSEVDSGTEIELTIPASRAYTTSARRFWWFRKPSQKDSDVKEKVDS